MSKSRDYQILLQHLAEATKLNFFFVERTLDEAIKEVAEDIVDKRLKKIEDKIKELSVRTPVTYSDR